MSHEAEQKNSKCFCKNSFPMKMTRFLCTVILIYQMNIYQIQTRLKNQIVHPTQQKSKSNQSHIKIYRYRKYEYVVFALTDDILIYFRAKQTKFTKTLKRKAPPSASNEPQPSTSKDSTSSSSISETIERVILQMSENVSSGDEDANSQTNVADDEISREPVSGTNLKTFPYTISDEGFQVSYTQTCLRKVRMNFIDCS